MSMLGQLGSSIGRSLEDLHSQTHRQKVVSLVLFGLVLHLALVTIDQAAYTGLIPLDYERGPDLPIFNERAETILSGRLLYRDVHTETPPVINLVMTIPAAMGGSLLAYQLFFSACNIAAALVLYETLRRHDERLGALVAVLFLVNPFTLFHATFDPQDEPLVLLFFIAPLCMLVLDRYYPSAAALGIGVWAKMWPVLIAPLYILERRDWRQRAGAIALMAIATVAIFTPFLLLAPEQGAWFLRFYFLGVDGEGSGGVSLWHFLDQVGAKPPSLVMLGLVAGVVLFGYWFARVERWGAWRTVTLVTVLFFLVYPKIHSGYYMLPLALLLPYIAQDGRLYGLSILMFATVTGTFKFADGTISPEGSLMAVPILLCLVTDLILLTLLFKGVVLYGSRGVYQRTTLPQAFERSRGLLN